MEINKICKNLKFSIVNYLIINLLKFLVRMVFVAMLSIEYLGINSLYSNILAVLSLAELGIGPAIAYSLYKPLAVEDRETVKSIMWLFRKVYIIVGFVILLVGLCLYPWIGYFIKDAPNIVDLNHFYIIFLLNTVVSYFWSYKRTLLIADQKQYYVNIYQAIVQVIVSLLQVCVLLFAQSYWGFLIIMFLGTVIENIIIANRADAQYLYLKQRAKILDKVIKDRIIRDVKAMIVHKIGGIVVFSSSNIILSRFVGLAAVGLYSNYYMVIAAMNTFSSRIFESMTASVGKTIAVGSTEEKQKSFYVIQFITAFQASLISTGLYVLLDVFIDLWLGKDYLLDRVIVMCIVLSFYLTYMRKGVLMYKDACGLFWHDRYKPVIESIIYITVSVFLTVNYGTIGVIIGGIVSTVFTCFWIEPYVLFRYALKMSLRKYFYDYSKFLIVTLLCSYLCKYWYNKIFYMPTLVNFVWGVFMVTGFVSLFWTILFRKRYEFILLKNFIISKIKSIV